MKENYRELFSKTSSGSIMKWSIWSEEDYIFMEYGVLGGETIVNDEHVPMGLAGRTLEEQIVSRINSRINKKIDQGYVSSIEDAKMDNRTNALGYKRPAKCHAWNAHGKNFPFHETYVQNKLDGHHCTIINDDGELIAYSSNGKIIDTIPEILSSIRGIPEGKIVEGELYCHETPLQTISSWVRRRQKDTKKLKFVFYDTDNGECYSERYEFLSSLECDNQYAYLIDTKLINGRFDPLPLLKQAVESKYEGLVLRATGFPHMDGKRSKGLLKVKPIHFKGEFALDDEFLVVNILSSKDGWAILVCETELGKRFKVTCHGDIPYREKVLKNKDNYLFRHVRVEYSGWTKDKKPFHPVALEWREKFEE